MFLFMRLDITLTNILQKIESNQKVENIVIEYHNNQDEFSKDIIISQLSTLFKYANRFYERQFLNRKVLSNDLLVQFNQYLSIYFESGQLQLNGTPSIEQIAEGLTVSQRYLSDTLKKETGKKLESCKPFFSNDKLIDIEFINGPNFLKDVTNNFFRAAAQSVRNGDKVDFKTLEAAQNYVDKVVNSRFPSAIVARYQDGIRIDLDE